MTPEERFDNALADVDAELAKGATVASVLAGIAEECEIPLHILRMRAERQFGNLSVRRRWHRLRRRSRNDVREFLAAFSINSDWQRFFDLEFGYEAFLSEKYKKKVTVQRMALAKDTLEEAWRKDFETREADRKARGVRLRRW